MDDSIHHFNNLIELIAKTSTPSVHETLLQTLQDLPCPEKEQCHNRCRRNVELAKVYYPGPSPWQGRPCRSETQVSNHVGRIWPWCQQIVRITGPKPSRWIISAAQFRDVLLAWVIHDGIEFRKLESKRLKALFGHLHEASTLPGVVPHTVILQSWSSPSSKSTLAWSLNCLLPHVVKSCVLRPLDEPLLQAIDGGYFGLLSRSVLPVPWASSLPART